MLWQALVHGIQKLLKNEICNGWKGRATGACAGRSIPKGLRPPAQGCQLFLKMLWQALAHRIQKPTDQKERATLGAHSDVPPTLKGLRHSDCIHRLPTACSNTFFHEHTHS